MEKKYRFYEYNERKFRVALSVDNDSWFGKRIYFEITESVEPPKNFFQRIKQFFSIKKYGSGIWNPSSDEQSLNDTIIEKIASILYWENEEEKARIRMEKELEEI